MIIIAAAVALVQISFARLGASSPLTTVGESATLALQEMGAVTVGSLRNAARTISAVPGLESGNRRLSARTLALERENARLREELAAYREEIALQPEREAYAHAIEARVVGFPPENAVQSVTIDKGTRSGVARDDGVIAADGVVGRIVEAGPFVSKISLITDFTSSIPAIVQRGRYWGIAKGNQTSVRLEYISQDAHLRVGDMVVTGEARSFHSGDLIGTIVAIERSSANLYQTAVVKPAAQLSSLDRVVVVPK